MARKKRDRIEYTIKSLHGRKNLYITWSENRKPQRISTGTNDSGEAQAYLRNFIAGLSAPPEPKAVTANKVLDEYKSAKKIDGSAYGTIENALIPIEEFFGPLLLENITPGMSREYIAKRRKLGRANDTIRRELGTLRAAINHCIREGWKIPSPSIILPQPSRPRERWLTKQEIQRLIAECAEDHLRLFVILAYTTCARKEAILSLTWDRVDLENYRIDYNPPDREETGKRRGVKIINKMAHAPLTRALEMAQTDFVIEWGGEAIKNIRRSFMTAVKEAKIPGKVTPHTIKHSAGVHMAMAGVPMWEISQMMDHTSTRTTEKHYLKFHPDFQKAASQSLEKL